MGLRHGQGRPCLGVEAPSKVRVARHIHERRPGARGVRGLPRSQPLFSSPPFGGAEARPNPLPLLGSSATAVAPAFGSHPVCARPSGSRRLGRPT